MRDVATEKNRAAVAVVALMVAVGLIAGIYTGFLTPKTALGIKTVNISVTANGAGETVQITTKAQYLGEALKEKGMVEGEQGPFGLFIESVNGIKADETKQEWWCITSDGQMLEQSADLTPIVDGGNYGLELRTGY